MSTITTPTGPTTLTGTYTIDPTHSRIGFVARHAMVTKVRGSFNEFDGSGYFDAENPAASQLQLTIQAASIDTRNADRDAHLRSQRLLRHGAPTRRSRFVSTAVEPGRRRQLPGDRRPHDQGRHQARHRRLRVHRRRRRPVRQPAHRLRRHDHRSTARTGASTGTPRSRPAACSSARRSPSSSRCPRSAPPTPPDQPAPPRTRSGRAVRLEPPPKGTPCRSHPSASTTPCCSSPTSTAACASTATCSAWRSSPANPAPTPPSCACPARATTTTSACSASAPPPRPKRRGAIGLYHLAWQLDTIDELAAARRRLLDAGAYTGESSHGATKSVYGADPDGNEFEIMWMLPRDAWGDVRERRPDRPPRPRRRGAPLERACARRPSSWPQDATRCAS